MSRRDRRRVHAARQERKPRAVRDGRAQAFPPWWRDRGLVVVLGAALIVKTIVMGQLGGHPLLQPLGELDTALYVELAEKIAAAGPLAVTEPFFLSPLYTYFLAAIFAAGGSLTSVRLVQILLGSAAVGLVFLTTRYWFGTRAAWMAAALALLTGLFTFYEILILQAALDPFLVAATLACVTRAERDDRLWPLAAAGVAAGLLALNRPNALAYAALLAVWFALRAFHARASITFQVAWTRALVLPAALLAVLLANGLRNFAASGEWVLISSHGGLNFYIGNNAEADGFYTRLPGISPSIAGQTRDATRVAEAAAGRRLSAGEVSTYFYGEAWDWIVRNPVAAMRLLAWKTALLLNRENVPLNFSYAYYSRDEPSLLRALIVGPWLLLPLGLVGLGLASARRTSRGFGVWAAFVPVYGLSVAAFFVSSRYRMPLLVPLCGSAAAALVWAYDRLRVRQAASLAGPLAAVAVIAVIVSWPLDLDDGRGFEQTRRAVWLIERGRIDEALDFVSRIAPSHPQPGVLHYRVGRTLAAANRFDEAVAHFRSALAMDPGQPATELELGQVLTVTGRAREALGHLDAALRAAHRPEIAAPWLVRALAAAGERDRAVDLIATLSDAIAAPRAETALDLGTMALELDAPAPAERWLRLAAEAEPDRAEAHEKLGVALLLLDRVGEAIAPLEAARRLDPTSASTRLNLAVTYARAGRIDDARDEAREAARLDPAEPRVAALLKELGPGRGP